jgi:Ca-activated chloride channel homolog
VTVPLLGPLSATGFQHRWCFLYALLVVAVAAGYLVAQSSRRRHVLRFANMDLLSKVAPPQRRRRLRHLPAVLLMVALALLTLALAGPTHAQRIPQNRAVVMLVIDVSESMASTDVSPNRLAAAKDAGKQFADEITPGINLGLVAFAGTASVLVPPTTNRTVMKAAIDRLQIAERTATGEGILTALQQIASVQSVVGSGDGPAPASIVLESDGKETVPLDPEAPRGAFSAAESAKEQNVTISTISFGTPDGHVDIDGQHIAVPVDDQTLSRIAEITGGELFHAGSLAQLNRVYATLQNQLGYQTVLGDASTAWIALGTIALLAAATAGLLFNRQLPG